MHLSIHHLYDDSTANTKFIHEQRLIKNHWIYIGLTDEHMYVLM